MAREGVRCVAESGYEEAPDCALRRRRWHSCSAPGGGTREFLGLGDMMCCAENRGRGPSWKEGRSTRVSRVGGFDLDRV